MRVTCTHSAARCPVSGQLDEDPNFWDGDPGVGVSPAEFHSHQLRAGVDRTEVSGSGAGPPLGGWSAHGLRVSRLPPPQESREAYTRLGVGPLELQNPGGSLDKSTGRGPSRGPDPGPFPSSLDHTCSQPASLLELEVPFPLPTAPGGPIWFILFIYFYFVPQSI